MTAACGTYAGWNRHKRAKTEPCPECKAAQARYARGWRHRTGRTTHEMLTPMEVMHLTGKSGDFL